MQLGSGQTHPLGLQLQDAVPPGLPGLQLQGLLQFGRPCLQPSHHLPMAFDVAAPPSNSSCQPGIGPVRNRRSGIPHLSCVVPAHVYTGQQWPVDSCRCGAADCKQRLRFLNAGGVPKGRFFFCGTALESVPEGPPSSM